MKDKRGTLGLLGRRVVAVAGGVALLSAIALLIGGHALAAMPPTIGIKEFKYAPSSITVPAGTTVTWINHDKESHTVTSATGAFSSARLVNDDSFVQTFKKPGTPRISARFIRT